MSHVCAYILEILITGKTEQEHWKTLEVLIRLEETGFKLKFEKLTFMQPVAGHISAKWIHPSKEKVHAIVDAPHPNVSQLRSFLGLVNYYCKFLPQHCTRGFNMIANGSGVLMNRRHLIRLRRN